MEGVNGIIDSADDKKEDFDVHVCACQHAREGHMPECTICTFLKKLPPCLEFHK